MAARVGVSYRFCLRARPPLASGTPGPLPDRSVYPPPRYTYRTPPHTPATGRRQHPASTSSTWLAQAFAWQRACSSLGLAGLKDVDGPGQLAGLPRAAAEFAQDVPGFELGVGALAGGSSLGVGPVGLLLRGGLVAAPAGGQHRVAGAVVALVGQHDQPGGGQLADDAPDPRGGQVVHGAGQRPGHPRDVSAWAGDDLQVHAVAPVLAGAQGPAGGDPADGD